MPQLDFITFLSQIFWLIFFFLFFFTFIFNKLTPLFSRIIKSRLKKSIKIKTKNKYFLNEKIDTTKQYNLLIKQTIKTSIDYITKCNSFLKKWLFSQEVNQKKSELVYLDMVKKLQIQKHFFKQNI